MLNDGKLAKARQAREQAAALKRQKTREEDLADLEPGLIPKKPCCPPKSKKKTRRSA